MGGFCVRRLKADVETSWLGPRPLPNWDAPLQRMFSKSSSTSHPFFFTHHTNHLYFPFNHRSHQKPHLYNSSKIRSEVNRKCFYLTSSLVRSTLPSGRQFKYWLFRSQSASLFSSVSSQSSKPGCLQTLPILSKQAQYHLEAPKILQACQTSISRYSIFNLQN